MRVSVDTSKCQGHSLCGGYAPDVFDNDDEGYSVVLTPDVAPEHEAQARTAFGGCPEQAIVLEE